MRPPIDPETQVVGAAMSSIVENIQRDDIQPYLDKYHLNDIVPDQWYSARDFISILREIGGGEGGMSNLVAIGMAVTHQMLVPPELDKVPLSVILMGWNDLYHLQHRNGNIGGVVTEKISDTHYRTIHTHLYPDDMTWGLAYGMAKRWLPAGTHFKVIYSPQSPRLDEGGGDQTVIDILWS